ncbi:MAG: hypothetical protein OXH07_08145 [Chloroflexi bacterium]|nr:hypothetical protein [Chloroflexota bacterium]
MQDRFVGDIGDFGKYGLLRALTGTYPAAEPRLSLGVVWYRNADEVGSPSDGQRLSYLDKPAQYEDCDPILFASLRGIVNDGRRSLSAIEESGILGENARFSDRPMAHHEDVVFLDPDKGLAFSAQQNSPEHAHISDVASLADISQTVVIYQSFGRQKGDTHGRQMRRWTAELQLLLPDRETPRVLRFRPWHPRAFIVMPSRVHAQVIRRRIDALLASPWGRHYPEPPT